MSLGTVKAPTLAQLREVAAELGMRFSEDELGAHQAALLPGIGAYNKLDRMTDELPSVTYPRLPGRRPSPEENAYGAWYVKAEIAGTAPASSKARPSR